jgi:hypothetical protein
MQRPYATRHGGVPARLAGGRRGAKPGRQHPSRGKGGGSENPCKDPMERATVWRVSGVGIVDGPGHRAAKPNGHRPRRDRGGKSENPCKDPMQRGTVAPGHRHRWRAAVVQRSPTATGLAATEAVKVRIRAKTLCNGARWRRAPGPLVVGRCAAKPEGCRPGRDRGGKSENPCKDPMERGTACGGHGPSPRHFASRPCSDLRGPSPHAGEVDNGKIRQRPHATAARRAPGAGAVVGRVLWREARRAPARPRQLRGKVKNPVSMPCNVRVVVSAGVAGAGHGVSGRGGRWRNALRFSALPPNAAVVGK